MASPPSTPAPSSSTARPPKDTPLSQSRVKRLSGAVGKTVDKLSRSVSGTSATSPTSPTSPASKRVFSISRKSRRSQMSPDREGARSPSASQNAEQSPLPKVPTSANEDSPFIRPPSPQLNASLAGTGSMRAGTQTLIQALQALPWMNVDNDEDGPTYPGSPGSADSESDDEERPPLNRLSSSIHTIHRPLARSHRVNIPNASRSSFQRPVPEEESLEDMSPSDEEQDNDFEETPRLPVEAPPQLSQQMMSRNPSSQVLPPPSLRERQNSMATVRLHRRARLAEKLREVYDLEDIGEVWAEMPCWLLRSVLLQGYMYLTNSYLCFFAHMPSREDQILKSSSLNKKAQRTKRWIKHWFVLKNDALSWYQSSSDPYFPHGILDLRYAISCDPSGEKGMRLRTNSRTIVLSADSVPSREEWVKAIRKVIFKAQNMGDSVKIAIPYAAILDVERSTAMDFSETIEVKVVDKEDNFSVDSYFFAYFQDLPGGLDQIRDAVRTHRSQAGAVESRSPPVVLDTTVPKTTLTNDRINANIQDSAKSTSSGFRLSSLFRPFSDTSAIRVSSLPAPSDIQSEEYTHISRKPNSVSFVPVASPEITTSPLPQHPNESSDIPTGQSMQSLPVTDHTYPPSTSNSSILPNTSSLSRDSSGSWAVGVPSWLKTPRKAFTGSSTADSSSVLNTTPVREIYSSPVSSPGPASRSSGVGDMAFSVLESPDMFPDQEATDKFRAAFAYDAKETLLGYFPGYIYRLIPISGKLYISSNYFCFKSSALTVRTRMALPLRDVLACEKSKAGRFGHHGLIIIVKGHEELFFEFGSEERRNAFVSLLERQLEDTRKRIGSGEMVVTSSGKRDALILEEFDARHSSADSESALPTDNMADSLPAVMFTSASSTFLTFKPRKALHFTFLTIGSRGDVQPYIALSKGLMLDGHKCKIATHGEFREWIESHGIEFGYVGGDPAELMRICIENGTFTVSFLKEGLLKFRGWLDDLLKTSWEACQGTDVLIESPSAMGGYHIAEALGIPYFRAFTMTWTRTRAYPHAFAVPEHKLGGSYNYMSYVMFDQVFWRATAGQINRWRRNLLHLGPTSLDKMEPHKIPFLYNFSPNVVPPPLDWPEWIRVTGYWFLDDAEVSASKWTPPASLVQFIDNARATNRKVVYIGFGSIVVPDPKAMTQCVIEAVLSSGVHAILSKGWSDRLQVKSNDPADVEEPLPPQIYPISSIPHDWLFQRIDAACHHGGAGTTGASLRAGIPTIIRPFFGDQFFWADRVEALGVGTGVRKLTASTLSDALVSATTDPKQIARAKTIGEQIKGENGVATAIESIYRDLDYARSLVKRHVVEDEDDEEGTAEDSTIRHRDNISPSSPSGYSSEGSHRGTPSEDWSVISDPEDRRLSLGSQPSERQAASKRTSLGAAAFSILPDLFVAGSSSITRNT